MDCDSRPDRVLGWGDATDGFHHEAFLYAGLEEFLHGTSRFIQAGLEADEPALVVVSTEKISFLRGELGSAAEEVQFADMAEIGSNPARIIQTWRDFVGERGDTDRPLRGIGEPIGPDRSAAELAECHRHEALLNLAFDETPAFWLMCPYDTRSLDSQVIERALENHPLVSNDGIYAESALYTGLEAAAGPFSDPLPEPSFPTKLLYFEAASLVALRQYVSLRAGDVGMSPARTEDLLLAVNEVATNSLRHGSGTGFLRMWEEADGVICEVRDAGTFDRPLAGRLRPTHEQIGGYGLWVANQLCDLVQVRSFETGTVVRLHMRRG